MLTVNCETIILEYMKNIQLFAAKYDFLTSDLATQTQMSQLLK